MHTQNLYTIFNYCVCEKLLNTLTAAMVTYMCDLVLPAIISWCHVFVTILVQSLIFLFSIVISCLFRFMLFVMRFTGYYLIYLYIFVIHYSF